MASKTKTIPPVSKIAGTLEVPGDKSISHRAVMLGALSEIPCRVKNFLAAEDCLNTVEAFRAMGISIDREETELQITGKGLKGLKAPKAVIDCGNSGTTTRLLMGILTGQPFDVELKGDASLSRRPMDRVIAPLTLMGASFPQTKGTLPLRIRGTSQVNAISYKSPVASAQIKSAVLLAGLYAAGVTQVEEPSLSRDHTERMLRASGVNVESTKSGVRLKGPATVRATEFVVPGDLSSAAFLLAAGLLRGSNVTVKNVGVNPTRTGFLEVIKAMGGTCTVSSARESGGEPLADIMVKKSDLNAFQVGDTLIPRAIDEIPILAVLATQAKGKTVIQDAKELRIKESDRLATVSKELTKMGARILERPDGLEIEGPTPLHGAVVNSHGDHRLAMSLAIAALVAHGPTTIEYVACVDTSFPNFWTVLERIGVRS